MHPDLTVHIFFSNSFVYFCLDLSHDFIDIILVFHLELLVMAAALIRGPFLKNFAQSKENFGGSSGLFGGKIIDVFPHEVKVNSVLFATPAPYP